MAYNLTKDEVASRQEAIVRTLGVKPTEDFDVDAEIERRVTFLKNQAIMAGKKGFVLGISGGLDSFNAGMLAKKTGLKLILMRLPYGTQLDEADAQAAIDVIQPDEVITYNIKPAVDAAVAQMVEAGQTISDYVKGNRKARERMLAQYDVAAMHNMLVIGTDHASEAVTGFYTKWGDGACDLTPLSTLNKRQGYLVAERMGAPVNIMTKRPTADLLDNKPQQADEDELGLTYDQINDFLEGKEIDVAAANKLIEQYDKTAHKRNPIPGV